EVEAALRPGRLEGREALVVRDVERREPVRREVEEPTRGHRALAKPVGIVELHLPLRRLVELALPHRQREVRRALEDRQVRGDLACLLDHLHAARAGADHADASSGDLEAVLWPVRRVEARTAEALETSEVGDVRPGGEAGARDEEPRTDPVAV